MRLVLTLLLAACGNGTDDVLVRDFSDATTSDVGFPDVFLPGIGDVGPPEPIVNGGPLTCGACTCDGTLYGCLEGAFGPDASCTTKPPPPPLGDASADDASCGKGTFCSQIPIACLPKPTCACIEKETNLLCTVAQNGEGFVLQCP